MFFSAPPSSTPFTSSHVYILKWSLVNSFCTRSFTSLCFDATTNAVGTSSDTSSAWLGPERTAIFEFGSSSFATSSKVFRLSFSKPFEQIITVWSFTYSLYFCIVLLVNFEGVTCRIISVSFTASSSEVVQYTFSGTSTFGSNRHLCSLFILSLSSSVNDHIFILCPIVPKCIARAVPQLPLPYD